MMHQLRIAKYKFMNLIKNSISNVTKNNEAKLNFLYHPQTRLSNLLFKYIYRFNIKIDSLLFVFYSSASFFLLSFRIEIWFVGGTQIARSVLINRQWSIHVSMWILYFFTSSFGFLDCTWSALCFWFRFWYNQMKEFILIRN